jgi:fructose-1,6-bisphosphatase I
VFDPLDGSSNIDCGVSVGTIFGIYKIDGKSSLTMEEQCLGPGSTMVCGGYCMYGSCSILTLALNGVANGYTLDPNLGEFLLTHPKVVGINVDEIGKEKDLFAQ